MQLEELAVLRRFEFFPRKIIDIEKPSSVSESHELWWKIPLHLEKQLHSMYIKNYEVRVDLQDVYIVHV